MKTYHDGAKEERRAWMAKLRSTTLTSEITNLIAWGKKRVARYTKRKGGL